MKKEALRILTVSWICGVVSIIYELVWVRYLGLILGNSVYAVGVVTGCYMTGMALGDFIVGRWTKKYGRAAQLSVLAGLAVMCLLSPVLYQILAEANARWALASWPGPVKLLWRSAISFGALLIPTFLLGGVIPVLTAEGKMTGGMIYAANTLGAVFGALLTGFFLIKHLGLAHSATAAAVLTAGALILMAGRGKASGNEGDGRSGTDGGSRKPQRGDDRRKTGCAGTYDNNRANTAVGNTVKKWVLTVYCISGFTGMAFQVYQTRILTLFFMDSVYDFAVILTVYLCGLCIGNLAASWLAWRKSPVGLLAVSQVLLGMCSGMSLHVAARLPFWTEGMQSQSMLYQRFGDQYFLMGILMKAGCTALLMFIPAILWGMAYPLVARICIDGSSDPGREAGNAMGWNTVGSALGSLGSSFLLIGTLGIQRSILLGACLNIGAGIGLMTVSEGKKKKNRVLAVSLAAVLCMVPGWDRFEMSTSFLKPGQDVEGYVDIQFYREDAYGITSVVDFLPYGQTYLTTNRLYCQNTSDMKGPEDHRRLGYIPMLLHQDPKRVLVEGLGAGVTLRGVDEYEGIQIDCVEISGAVAEAARYFEEENGGVLESPQVSLMIDDARNYLLTADQAYDVIIADIFFPMSAGSGSMFSREYYEACRKALNPGGVMVQWIPIHQFSKQELQITMKTFSEVFPNTTVWFGMLGNSVPVAGLVGTGEPLKLSFGCLEAIYSGRRKNRMDLRDTALDDPYMFLSHYVGSISPEDFPDSIPCNTDGRPVLEYLNPMDRQTYGERGRDNMQFLLDMKGSAGELVEFYDPGQRAVLESYDAQIREFIKGLTAL